MTRGYLETRKVRPFKAGGATRTKRSVEYQPLVQVVKVLIHAVELIPVAPVVRKGFLIGRLVHVINFSEIIYSIPLVKSKI